MEQRNKASLILANGMVFDGQSFGKQGTVIGEIVFSTGMTGYQETLTDPSYCGQIVTQTFPLIGNYGINSEDFESSGSVVGGYVVREHCEYPSNFRMEKTLDAFLVEHGIVGICDIDTRKLTRIIRETGVMNGKITTEEYDLHETLAELKAFHSCGAVPKVSVREKQEYKADSSRFRVALMDYGYKHSIRNCLTERGCDVTVYPYDTPAEEILVSNPDGIMLSNGPGDPTENSYSIEQLKKLYAAKIPTFGICLGHQLMALANGARSLKLKYGHRGGNQPVKDIRLGKTFITSQNHGYAVVGDSVPSECGAVSHINANDGTCEGIRYHTSPVFTVQFHPEAHGGPNDTAYLFDEFVEMMEENKKCR